MKQLIVMIVLFLNTVVAAHAESDGRITGQVVDGKTRDALIGVNVNVIGTTTGASTDSNGNYVIPGISPGTYVLQFSYIGYETVNRTDVVVSTARPTVVNVAMEERLIELGTVTVSSGYFSNKFKAPVSEMVLSREEIRRYPGGFSDVVRTVSTLPGVSPTEGGGRNDLLVRGGGPAENLYVINNIEVPNINHYGAQGTNGGILSFVNLDFVESTSFSSGGFGVQYGDKMSSVLSLNMRDGRTDRLGGKATISATQFGLDVEGPLRDRGNFIFSARQSYLDIIFRAAGFSFIPSYTDFNFVGNYNISPSNRLFVLSLAAIDRVDRDQSTAENRVTNAGIMDNSQNQIINGVNFRHLYSKKGFIDLTLNHNYNDYNFSQIDENEEEWFRSEATEQEFGVKLSSTYRPMEMLNVDAGVTMKYILNDNRTTFADSVYNRSGERIPVDELGVPQEFDVSVTAQKYAGYVELEPRWKNGFTAKLGLRADYYDFINESFYPSARLALGYRFTEGFKIKGSLGRFYQSPSYLWVVNEFNRDLKALYNDMAILSFDYLLQSDLNLTVEGFFKDYHDLPTGAASDNDYLVLTNTGAGYGGRDDDFQSFGYRPLVSTGKGQAYGFEMLLQKKFSEIPCYGQVGLSYGQSEYTAGNGLTYPGQYDRRIVFNLSGGYILNDKWEFSAKFRYMTGTPYTPVYRPSDNDGEIQNLPAEYLSERLDAAHQLDVRVDRRFNFNKWTMILFVDIQNIYNYEYPTTPNYDFYEDRVVDTNELALFPTIGISAEF